MKSATSNTSERQKDISSRDPGPIGRQDCLPTQNTNQEIRLVLSEVSTVPTVVLRAATLHPRHQRFV